MSRRFLTLLVGILAVAVWMAGAQAAPREGAQRPAPPAPRNQPSATVPQTEPMDLDEGKSGQQMFSSSCSVCHQSAQGLAKGRGAGQLGSFLRQHYTTGTNQANTLAGYLTSGGLDRGAPTPVRGSPGDKPDKPEPATTARKPKPDETRGRPEPAVAATHPQRRIRNEDGTTQPVEGLVVLPPGASEVPDDDGKPAERRRETRPPNGAWPPASAAAVGHQAGANAAGGDEAGRNCKARRAAKPGQRRRCRPRRRVRRAIRPARIPR